MNTFNHEYLRPTILDVDLDALVHNYKEIKKTAKSSKIMPILKANAYGHGLVQCAKVLEKQNPWSFGVAFLEEGIELRKAGIKTPVLALGGVSGRQIDAFLDFDIDFCASSIMKIEAINEKAKARGVIARVQIKLDTGMERIGIHHYNAENLFKAVQKCKNCEVVAVFSHLADAENVDKKYNNLQYERFMEAVSFFEKNSLPTPKLHLANSAAAFDFSDSRLDVVRPGISLFGVSPFDKEIKAQKILQPTMGFKSEVVFFKVIEKDAYVSYGLTWQADRQTRIATIAVGYGDGYPRVLSNKARVLIRGRSYPVVGRICMDQFMVDLGPDGEAYNGDEVTLIGSDGDQSISVEELSKLSNIDPRDLMLRIAPRVPRRYHFEGKTFLDETA